MLDHNTCAKCNPESDTRRRLLRIPMPASQYTTNRILHIPNVLRLTGKYKGRRRGAHNPQTAALSPEITRMLCSEPVAAPARMLLAKASAEPFANSFACERSFHAHASHTATFLSSPAEQVPFGMNFLSEYQLCWALGTWQPLHACCLQGHLLSPLQVSWLECAPSMPTRPTHQLSCHRLQDNTCQWLHSP